MGKSLYMPDLKQRGRRRRITDFREVVARIVNDHEPDVHRLDAIIHDAGKSLDDLRQAVEQVQYRRQATAPWL